MREGVQGKGHISQTPWVILLPFIFQVNYLTDCSYFFLENNTKMYFKISLTNLSIILV